VNRIRHALRTLTKTPFVTAVAVLSLALGIGGNAAIFSLFDQILLQALPVQEPERLVNFANPGEKRGSTSCGGAGGCDEVFSYPMFLDLQAAESGFSGIALHNEFGANVAVDGRTTAGGGMLVSGSYFPVLGLRPAIGRLLGPADDENIGENFVAVLSHGYWSRELGADPSVLNKSIIVNGQAMTIVGVAPEGFHGTTLGSRPDVFVPVTMRSLMNRWFDGFEDRNSYWGYLFARLKDGVELEQAGAELNTAYSAIINEVEAPLNDEFSEATMERFRSKQLVFKPGQQGQSTLQGEASTPLLILFTLTGIVLLIASANVANLLLARGATRSAEMAIRASLGASRRQLVGQLLVESCLLALLGGAASLIVARWTLGGILSMLPPEAASIFSMDLRPGVVLFAAALSLGTGILFGIYPALYSTRADLNTTLRESSGQPSGARSAARFRNGLVVVQLAMSMALLVAAGLFIKSLVNVSRVDLGIDATDLVTFRLSPERNGYTPDETRELFNRLEESLATLPGVRSVTAGLVPLIAGSSWGTNVSVEGYERGPDVDSMTRFNRVGADYFSTVGIPLIAGREFTTSDTLDAPNVAVVNETFARKFGIEGRQAVGKWMAFSSTDELDIEIVGLVEDAKYSDVKREVPPLLFVPHRQDENLGFINFYARTEGDPDAVLRAVPGVVSRLDPNLPVDDLKTLEIQIRENIFMDRMISTLAASFAMLATVLAAIGLYGVLAFTVAQRTREIGLRMALGASEGTVRGMVLRQVGRLAAIGGAIGVGLALLLGRGAQSLLYELEGHDPVVVAASVLALAVVALGAAYVPALRASRVDPMQALRFD
jgi:predicted permease